MLPGPFGLPVLGSCSDLTLLIGGAASGLGVGVGPLRDRLTLLGAGLGNGCCSTSGTGPSGTTIPR